MQNAIQYAKDNREAFLAQLIEFLSIPSISTLPEHKADVERAAEWLAAEMRRIGLENVQVIETSGNPVVFGQRLDAGPGAPTVLIYGHYDVQPVDPLEAWESPPFEPQLRDGRVYARGASDNKSQHFSHLKAVEAILETAGKLPLNLKFCIDGEEEVGSPSVPELLESHLELLACDSILISDGAMAGEDQPSIEYALRGIVDFDVLVYGPGRDLHSGSYGGTVHNPAQAVSEIVAALHDKDGRVTIPGFYDDVAPLSEHERETLARVPFDEAQWRVDTGAPRPWGEAEYSLLERMTARPTCEVNGIWGGFSGEGMKTIIPAEAGVKISMRLVAEQDPDKIAASFERYVGELAPDTVLVEVVHHTGCRAAVSAYDGPETEAAAEAYRHVWENEAVISRAGGSLPIVAEFQRNLKAPFVLMPLGLDDNRHSPNEHYRLDYYEKGVETAIRYYYALAARHPGK
ncbi:dipeptidase [Chloroflexota bacterium]